jgi:hypothetical protein
MNNVFSMDNGLADDGTYTFKGVGNVAMNALGDASASQRCIIINKAAGAPTQVTLTPNPGNGMWALVKDGKGDAATNNITIIPYAGTIDGAAAFLIDRNYGGALFRYNGVSWNLVSKVDAQYSAPPITQGALTTVGAGSITGALVADALVLRGGAQVGAFTDTSVTGTAMAAALPNIQIGTSFLWTYQNNTAYVATLAGGVGVTLASTIGASGSATFLVTYTALNTFVFTPYGSNESFVSLPAYQYTTGTTTTTFLAGQLTGGQFTIYTSTAATPGSIATRTATLMFGDLPGATVGMQFVVRIINDVATNSMTITAGVGVTLSGKTTYVVTPFGFIDFLCEFLTSTTMSMTFIGAGVGTTA